MQQHDAASTGNAPEYVNGRDAAQILNVSYSHFRQLLRTGQGPRHIQLGRARRFSVATLREYMQEREH